MAKKPAKPVERFVVVTTAHRGVFGGYLVERTADTVKLRAGRNCLYWPRENKGFVGLAKDGPARGSRVGPAADMELTSVTAIVDVTPEAVAKWEAAPWS